MAFWGAADALAREPCADRDRSGATDRLSANRSSLVALPTGRPWTAGPLVAGVTYVAGGTFATQYAVWAVVLLSFAGRWRAALLAQAFVLLPMVMVLLIPTVDGWRPLAVDVLFSPLSAAAPFLFLYLGLRGVHRVPGRIHADREARLTA